MSNNLHVDKPTPCLSLFIFSLFFSLFPCPLTLRISCQIGGEFSDQSHTGLLPSLEMNIEVLHRPQGISFFLFVELGAFDVQFVTRKEIVVGSGAGGSPPSSMRFEEVIGVIEVIVISSSPSPSEGKNRVGIR